MAAVAQTGGGTSKIVVPTPAGGSADLTARTLARGLQDLLPDNLIVENRPGASMQIGFQAVMHAAKDGKTLLVTPNGPVVVSPHLQKLPYDPLKDLAPVAMIARVPAGIAVPANSPIRNVQDFIKEAKRKPGGLTYSVSGLGIHMHLAGELLSIATGAPMRAIPYKGTNPAATAIAAGDVDAGISDMATLIPHEKAGRLRIIAVTDSARYAALPEVPTVAEQGVPGYAAEAWMGTFAPAGTPAAIVAELSLAVEKVLDQRESREALAGIGLEPFFLNSEAMGTFIRDDSKKWADLIKQANIKIE